MNYTGCRALSDEEIRALLDAMNGRHWARNRAWFTLGRYTGFRISEILSLRVKDVWDGSVISDSVTVAKGFTKGKKAARTMPLHAAAKEALDLHLRVSAMDHPLYSEWPLFPRQGKPVPMSRHQALAILHSAAAAAGISQERLGTHVMRKSFASACHDAVGRDLARLARLLGHTNPANTLRYVEFKDRELENIVLSM